MCETPFDPGPRAAETADSSEVLERQSEASSAAHDGFAVLPHSTEGELTLSEVRSHLDRALRFLQQHIGYALLDDALPRAGAGVRLTQSAPGVAGPPVFPRGTRSSKVPQEQPLNSSCCGRAEPFEDLDSNVIDLLHATFRRSGGKLRASELASLLAMVCQRESSFALNDGQWDRLFSRADVEQDREIAWEDFRSFYTEIPKAPADVADISAMSPDVCKHAHYKCDLVLVSRFAHLIYTSAVQDTLLEMSPRGSREESARRQAERRCARAVKHDGFYINCLLAVRLLHQCNYDYADVVVVLAYASVYFRSTFNTIGNQMSPTESAHVVVLLIFLAHSFILDETCPLRIWQKHIFRHYCTLKVLNAALFRVFQMRPNLSLMISDEEESMALLGLSGLRYSLGDPHSGEEDEGEQDLQTYSLAVSTPASAVSGYSQKQPEEDVSVKQKLTGPSLVDAMSLGKACDDETTPGHCTTTDDSE